MSHHWRTYHRTRTSKTHLQWTYRTRTPNPIPWKATAPHDTVAPYPSSRSEVTMEPIEWNPISSIYDIEPVLVTLLFFLYCVCLCELGRRLTDKFVKDLELKCLLVEFFGTMQICVVLYEAKHIFKHYGMDYFTLTLFLLVLVHCYSTRTAYCSPCVAIYFYRCQLIGCMCAMSIMAAQACAAFAAFQMAKTFWFFGLRTDHAENYQLYQCSTGIHVPIVFGFLAECTATAINRLVTLNALEHLPKLWPFAVAGIWTVLVRLGMNVTGCYQNPILASALTWHCVGYGVIRHLTVYWLGPVVGFQLASHVYFYRRQCPSMMCEYLRSFCPTSFNVFSRSSKTPKNSLASNTPLLTAEEGGYSQVPTESPPSSDDEEIFVSQEAAPPLEEAAKRKYRLLAKDKKKKKVIN